MLINIWLEQNMGDAFESHSVTVSPEDSNITKLHFAYDKDGVSGKEEDIASLLNNMNGNFSRYGIICLGFITTLTIAF